MLILGYFKVAIVFKLLILIWLPLLTKTNQVII